MITLKQSDYAAILRHAEACLPNEACGLIAGEINGERKLIKKVYLLQNADNSPEHFSIDPKEQLAAVKDMRQNKLLPLGNWHSHPQTPSRPSAEDIRLAYDKNASYLILSLMEPNEPRLNSFLISEDTAEKETLVISG